MIESFKDYVAVETMEGDNKYDAGEHGLQVLLEHTHTHTHTHTNLILRRIIVRSVMIMRLGTKLSHIQSLTLSLTLSVLFIPRRRQRRV